MTDWQPMDTAPRDGSMVLMSWSRRVVWPERPPMVDIFWWEEKEDRWKWLGDEAGFMNPFYFGMADRTPMGWMPIPAPAADITKEPSE